MGSAMETISSQISSANANGLSSLIVVETNEVYTIYRIPVKEALPVSIPTRRIIDSSRTKLTVTSRRQPNL